MNSHRYNLRCRNKNSCEMTSDEHCCCEHADKTQHEEMIISYKFVNFDGWCTPKYVPYYTYYCPSCVNRLSSRKLHLT